MQRRGFDAMRAVGKAWAKAAPTQRRPGYLKRAMVALSGAPIPCRGAARAARRRAQKAVVKAARVIA